MGDFGESNLLDTLLPDEDELGDSAVGRVFILFKLLFINLLFGTIFTFCCFFLRRHIGKCLSVLCCGLCDGFSCDYDGSMGSQSAYEALERRKRKHRRHGQLPLQPDEPQVDCDCKKSVEALWSNKYLIKVFGFWLMGIVTAYFLFSTGPLPENYEPVTFVHSFSRYSLTRNTNKSRIIFVMPTHYSGIQNARLVKIAQALLPVKHMVTWVIVSADPVSGINAWSNVKKEHWTTQQRKKWRTSIGRVQKHLELLHSTVARFGIPFVLLSGHELHHKNFGFPSELMKWNDNLATHIKSVYVGLTWVANNLKKGVLLIGDESTIYDSRLFAELTKTKIMSSWPTAFDPRYRFSISSPDLDKKNRTVGYVSGGTSLNKVPLIHSTYGIRMKIVNQLKRSQMLGKLAILDNTYSSKDLAVKISQVMPLAKNCTQIYAWRLETTFGHMRVVNSQQAPRKIKWIGTNVKVLQKLINTWYSLEPKK